MFEAHYSSPALILIQKSSSPLFRGRYKAILVQEDEYLTHLIRYIHLNPIQANLTEDLLKYPWTSHKQYLKGKDESPWLHTRLGLSFFSNKLKQAMQNYHEFIRGGVDQKTLLFYSQKKQNPILGDPDFLEMIKEKYILTDKKLSTEIPEQRTIQGQSKAQEITNKASKIFQRPQKELFISRRGETNYARLATVALTRELSGLRLSEIAKFFGMNSYKSVGTSCYRLKIRLASERDLRSRYEKLKLACSQEEI